MRRRSSGTLALLHKRIKGVLRLSTLSSPLGCTPHGLLRRVLGGHDPHVVHHQPRLRLARRLPERLPPLGVDPSLGHKGVGGYGNFTAYLCAEKLRSTAASVTAAFPRVTANFASVDPAANFGLQNFVKASVPIGVTSVRGVSPIHLPTCP